MSFKEVLDHFRTEGRVIKQAPFAFASCVLICAFGIFCGVVALEEWHYTGTISEKDATIEQEGATITRLSNDLGDAKQENENLQNSHTNYFVAAQSNTNAIFATQIIGKPMFDLYLNGEYITNGIIIPLGEERSLFFEIYNVGGEPATNLTFVFFSPFNQTNFIFDNHWMMLGFAQPFPIKHKMYDLSRALDMEIISQNPDPSENLHNGFNVTAFKIAPSLQPVSNPIEKLQQFGQQLDCNLPEPKGSYIPVAVGIYSADSETNTYCIFLQL